MVDGKVCSLKTDLGRAEAKQVKIMALFKLEYRFVFFLHELFLLIYAICFALCAHKTSSGKTAVMVS